MKDFQEAKDIADKAEKVQKEVGNAPECFTFMRGRVIDYKAGQSMTVVFPVLKEYSNPAGSMQGGFITAAFDNVFGPLSHSVMKSLTTTVDINTSFHRPIFYGDELLIIASLKSKGKRVLHMTGEACNSKNQLIATANTNYIFLKKQGE